MTKLRFANGWCSNPRRSDKIRKVAADPTDVGELFADLCAGIERSRAEDGCESYSFGMEDEDAGFIFTLQIWRDEEALAKHLMTPDIGVLVAKWTGRYDVQTRIYDVTGERAVGVWRDATLGDRVVEAQKRAMRS